MLILPFLFAFLCLFFMALCRPKRTYNNVMYVQSCCVHKHESSFFSNLLMTIWLYPKNSYSLNIYEYIYKKNNELTFWLLYRYRSMCFSVVGHHCHYYSLQNISRIWFFSPINSNLSWQLHAAVCHAVPASSLMALWWPPCWPAGIWSNSIG